MDQSFKRKFTKFGFVDYNHDQLMDRINNLQIYRVGNTVVTKYYNRIINTTDVSDIYEVFDISSFLRDKIEKIRSNFNILFYRFGMKRGRQELTLISDPVEIDGSLYYKAFFILNSSDKSRKLNMNMGLWKGDTGTYSIGHIKNMGLSKRHTRGVTTLAEEVSESINNETFQEQIDALSSLVGQNVYLSSVRDAILVKDLRIHHSNFEMFCRSIAHRQRSLTSAQYQTLMTKSEKLVLDMNNDFPLDAFQVFNAYMSLFSNQDSYIVKKETEKIMKITQSFIRQQNISKLLDLI